MVQSYHLTRKVNDASLIELFKRSGVETPKDVWSMQAQMILIHTPAGMCSVALQASFDGAPD